MKREEAVERANRWVRSRYAVVPPVAMVLDFASEEMPPLQEMSEQRFAAEDLERCLGKWCVLFRCSWDTDKQALPLRLGVLIDDRTGEAHALWDSE